MNTVEEKDGSFVIRRRGRGRESLDQGVVEKDVGLRYGGKDGTSIVREAEGRGGGNEMGKKEGVLIESFMNHECMGLVDVAEIGTTSD